MWGTGSVIRGSGSQTRGAGSEIRWDPPEFKPWAYSLLGKFATFNKRTCYMFISKTGKIQANGARMIQTSLLYTGHYAEITKMIYGIEHPQFQWPWEWLSRSSTSCEHREMRFRSSTIMRSKWHSSSRGPSEIMSLLFLISLRYAFLYILLCTLSQKVHFLFIFWITPSKINRFNNFWRSYSKKQKVDVFCWDTVYIHRESKKTRHQSLCHNFTNYYPIFKFFSLADSVVNLQQIHV